MMNLPDFTSKEQAEAFGIGVDVSGNLLSLVDYESAQDNESLAEASAKPVIFIRHNLQLLHSRNSRISHVMQSQDMELFHLLRL